MENKENKRSFNLHSIYVKILILVLISIIAFFLLNIVYIIPKAKATIQSVNEHNMQDLATLCAEIVEQEIEVNGVTGVNYETLKPVLEGRGLNGIESSYIYVINQEGTFIYHKKPDKIDTKVANAEINKLITEIPSGNYVASNISRYTDENGVVKYSAYQVIKSTGWVTVCVADDKDIMAEINAIRNVGILLSTIMAAVVLLIGIIAARGITNPIQIITGIIKNVAALNFVVGDDIEKLEHKRDETGIMARAVSEMENNLINSENKGI